MTYTPSFHPEEMLEQPTDPRESDMIACAYCGESILKVARKCKHCNEYLDPDLRREAMATAAAAKPTLPPPPPLRTAPLPPRPAPLPPPPQQIIVKQNSDAAVAGLCSFFLPGLGQMVTGRVGSGIGWMLATFFGYILLFFPGLIFHFFCILNAVKGAKG